MNSLKLFFFTFLASINSIGAAQEVTVSFEKDISFGEFYSSGNSAGSVCVSNNGALFPSSNIRVLRSNYHPATVIISTTSEREVNIQFEARAERLKSQKGGNLRLILNEPREIFYTISRGRPARINLGGCLEIDSKSNNASGKHIGKISVFITILRD